MHTNGHAGHEHRYHIPDWQSPDGKISVKGKTVECRFRTVGTVDETQRVGGEVELGVVDIHGRRRAMRELLHRFNDELPEHTRVSEEVSPHVIEQNIRPGTPDEFRRNYVQSQAELLHVAKKFGTTLLPFGAIPFAGNERACAEMHESLFDHENPHYRYLLYRDAGHLENLEGLSSVQFHVQQQYGPAALAIARGLSYATPYLAAMAASSPVHDGKFRGVQSERLAIKSRLPFNGTPPAEALGSMASLRIYLEHTSSHLRSIAPGYYNVRLPRVELGTVENCVMDMQPDPQNILMLGDLNMRVCHRLAKAFRDGEKLPRELFGTGTLDADDRAWIDRTLQSLLRAKRLFDETVTNPEGVQMRVRDAIHTLASWAGADRNLQSRIDLHLYRGTAAEQLVDSLRLPTNADSMHPVEVEESKLTEAYLDAAESYRRKIEMMCHSMS